MFVKLINYLRNKIRCRQILKEQQPKSRRNHIYPPDIKLINSNAGNTVVVGCSCGNPEITKEWDADLGAYYYFYDCKKCNYYWEGPIYCE